MTRKLLYCIAPASVTHQVRCRHGAREETCYVKGSVESVLEHCSSFQGRHGSSSEMGEEERRRVLDAASALGLKGRRWVSSVHLVLCRHGIAYVSQSISETKDGTGRLERCCRKRRFLKPALTAHASGARCFYEHDLADKRATLPS